MMKHQSTKAPQMESTLGQAVKNILVIGAAGGTGRATVEQLLRGGHRVTAFSRNGEFKSRQSDRLRVITGDATALADINRAVAGQDVVIVILGINENPLRVRLFGATRTPDNIRSIGTQNVIAAMVNHGVSQIIIQSSYGVGMTRHLLGFADRLVFTLLLKPQIEDTEIQEQQVRDSGLDWVIVQPVHLTDDNASNSPFISTQGQTRMMKVARQSVAQFFAVVVGQPEYIGQSVAVSG